MKKKSLFKLFFAAFGILVGLNSCSKSCYTCTYYVYKVEFCEKNFDSRAQFEDRIKEVESNGFTCR